jgi:hypothetical protein
MLGARRDIRAAKDRRRAFIPLLGLDRSSVTGYLVNMYPLGISAKRHGGDAR